MHKVHLALSDWNEKIVQYTLRCIWTWLNPSSTDRHFCSERDECVEECRLQPWAKVCIPQQYSTDQHTVAHLLQQPDVQEAAWLVVCAHRAKVWGNNWPRPQSKKSTWYAATLPLKTSENSCTTTVWKTKEFICDIETDTELPATHAEYISNWDGTSHNRWSLSTIKITIVYSHCEIRVQRDSVDCGSNFSGGGIIKTVPSLDTPHGSVALIPNCFSIKLKEFAACKCNSK